jgi:hypothetical protein
MYRRFLTILFVAIVVTLAVPLFAALAFDQVPARTLAPRLPLAASAVPPLASPVSESGALVIAGGTLIGLAAVVRRQGRR